MRPGALRTNGDSVGSRLSLPGELHDADVVNGAVAAPGSQPTLRVAGIVGHRTLDAVLPRRLSQAIDQHATQRRIGNCPSIPRSLIAQRDHDSGEIVINPRKAVLTFFIVAQRRRRDKELDRACRLKWHIPVDGNPLSHLLVNHSHTGRQMLLECFLQQRQGVVLHDG